MMPSTIVFHARLVNGVQLDRPYRLGHAQLDFIVRLGPMSRPASHAQLAATYHSPMARLKGIVCHARSATSVLSQRLTHCSAAPVPTPHQSVPLQMARSHPPYNSPLRPIVFHVRQDNFVRLLVR